MLCQLKVHIIVKEPVQLDWIFRHFWVVGICTRAIDFHETYFQQQKSLHKILDY